MILLISPFGGPGALQLYLFATAGQAQLYGADDVREAQEARSARGSLFEGGAGNGSNCRVYSVQSIKYKAATCKV